MKTISAQPMNLFRCSRARRPLKAWLAIPVPLKKFPFVTLTLLGFLAGSVSSKADTLLVGKSDTSVTARLYNSGTTYSDGGTAILFTSAQSYVASYALSNDFVSSTGATQVSNDDGADVARISYTGATNLSAEDIRQAFTATQIAVDFSVTAPVTYQIQGDFKGELSGGPMLAASRSSLGIEGDFLSHLYYEDEYSTSSGVFHLAANLANDGIVIPTGFVVGGALTGVLMPGIDYHLSAEYSVGEGDSPVNVAGFSLANYSITFTRVADDGTGDGGSGGGGGAGGGGASTVPDGGSSVGLISLGMLALAVSRRRYGLFAGSLLPA